MDFFSIISILISFIQVKFQGKLITPFETHPLATGVAICSLLLHFLLLHLANRAPLSSGRAPACDGASSHLLIDFTGSISVASLAWLLLHDFFHSVLLVLLLLLSVSLLRNLFQKLWLWLYSDLIQNLWLWLYGEFALMIICAARSPVWRVGRVQPHSQPPFQPQV